MTFVEGAIHSRTLPWTGKRRRSKLRESARDSESAVEKMVCWAKADFCAPVAKHLVAVSEVRKRYDSSRYC